MISIKIGETYGKLEPWGTVADLGSEILEGDAKAFGRMLFGTPDQPVSNGYFGVTKSKFKMVYPFHEHATVVAGRVILTDLNSGQTVHYGVGDSWFITKGTHVLWEVPDDIFVKNYMASF